MLGGPFSYDGGGRSDALITTRDGIVGRWNPPGKPVHHDAENVESLARWDPGVRATLFGYELVSRIGLSVEPAAAPLTTQDRRVSVWHLETTAPTLAKAGDPPSGKYRPLVRFDRPDEAVFEGQLQFLRSYADLRPDRAVEILEQFGGPAPFLGSIAFLRPDAKRWTMELIGVVLQFAIFVEQRIKHGLACRRPVEYSAQVQPMILTPGHGSLPSGHATESFATALVLCELLKASGTAPYSHPSYRVQLMRVAARIAINRTVAGVHFPIDSVAGALLGLTLGDYFVARAYRGAPARTYLPAHFDGTAKAKPGTRSVADTDFLWSQIYDVDVDPPKVVFAAAGGHPCVRPFKKASAKRNVDLGADTPSLPLEWLWDKACAEWK